MAGCIFCGRVPQTKTHIFRKAWIETLMPSDQPFEHRHVRTGDDEFDKAWEARTFGLAPKAACAPCNNDWMSDIDYAAEALIEPCVLGHAATFNEQEAHTIARWATLVAILFDQTQAAPIIDGAVCRDFFADPNPFTGSFAWLAGTPAREHAVGGWPRTWQMKSSAAVSDGYFCTFRIKHLVVQIYMRANSRTEDVEFERGDNPQVVALWPSPGSVSWPPPELIRAVQLEIFAGLFINN